MNVVLIPVGGTDWRAAGRLLGRAELSLTPDGERQAAQWAEQLRPQAISRIYHSPDELATRTGEIMAEALGIGAKSLDELAEVDFGLWAGLTDEQLEQRFATAHHQLLEAPLSVTPPSGEEFLVAVQRVREKLRKLSRRATGQTIGLVLRPMLFALTRWLLERGDDAAIWETARAEAAPAVYAPLNPAVLRGGVQ